MKKQPGQVVLALIDHALSEYGLLENPVVAKKRGSTYTPEVESQIKEYRAEAKAWRAAFKKMAGMSKSELGYLALLFFGVSQSWTTPLLVKDILKARAVEKR
jgi:hypothetical protein